MANSWLRLYHDMPNDPKWRTIARAAKQAIPLVLAVYVHLLTIASGAIDRGTLVNVNSEDLASALDVDCASVDAVLDAMQGRVLEGEKLSGWEKRQTNREDSSTERVKKWRETKVKRNVTQRNAMKPDVTHVKHNVTADKNREEEIKKETKTSLRQAQSEPRHVPFKLACETYAKYKGVTFVWDGGEAKILASLLAASPDLTLGTFQQCLNHRARSVVTHGDRPREWLGTILKYQEGPLDQYGKPQGVGNGNRNQSKTGGNIDAARGALAILAEAERNSSLADEMQPEAGGCGESGDLSDLRAGSIELRD